MKKNENFDFSFPQRQSYVAILLIAYKLYKVLLRQLFPFLVIFLFGNKLKKASDSIFYIIIAVAVLGGIYSIISFFKYYFFLKENKLVIQKGVFKKSTTEIPFDRIQSINFEQNIIHRIFDVVKLNMDTAGSSGNEMQLTALSKPMATALSDRILKYKSTRKLVNTTIENNSESTRSNKEIIFNLSILKLLKVGLTANHIRSGGIIIFFIFWIWDNLREIGLDVQEHFEKNLPSAEVVTGSIIVIIALVILFMLLAFVISLIRTVLKYFNLKMFRMGDGFVIESGLFNRREQAAKDQKIQLLIWSQNLLQKWTHIYQLVFKQAASASVSASKSIQVAGLDLQDVEASEKYIFQNRYPELNNLEYIGVNSYYRFRKFYYTTLFFIPIISYLAYTASWNYLAGAVLFYIYNLWRAHLNYKKKRYAITANLLVLRGGTFGERSTILKLYKIQNISLKSNYFQCRRKLCNLILHTASGSIVIPQIPRIMALKIKNYMLYKVESSKVSWM